MLSLAQNYYLSALITSIADLFLLILVLSKATNRALAKRFCYYTLAIAHWSFFVFWCTYVNDKKLSYILCQICHVGGVFIPITFLHFVLEYTNYKTRFSNSVVRIGYFITTVISLVIIFFPQLFVTDVVPKLTFNYFPSPGPIFIFWNILFVMLVFYGLSILLLESFNKTGSEKKAALFFLLANALGYSGGIGCFFPVYNLSIFPFPYGIWGVFFFTCVTAFAVLKYKLIDIEIIIKRAAVFAGLFAFVYCIFGLATILGHEFFKAKLGWHQRLALIPTVFIITFTLRPLETFLTHITDRFLFQKKYDYRELLKTFTNEILTVLDLQKLMDQTVAGLIKIMKLESAAILLLDKNSKAYRVVASNGTNQKDIEFAEDDALITYLKASSNHILKDKSVDRLEGHSHLREDFKKLNACLCMPIELHHDLIGVLCLGQKKSGEDHTQEDIDILNTLARTEAIAISNARLFDELSKTQAEAAQREKMAVIGTLAAGINHEICNPLGIVRGHCEMFLLNYRDGFYGEKSREDLLVMFTELMDKVIRETDRATAITKKLSSFARPSKHIQTEEVHAQMELEEVLGLVEHDLKVNNIDIQKDFPQNFPIFLGDRKQIQEVLFNIIRNAAQAIDKKQGRILISGFSDNGSAVIRISDNGCGVPKDKLAQIFNPFFTTKAPGKGTGLGLFIVKQIIERNKGTIALDSEEGIGTTFTLRFPVRQPELIHA